MFLILLGLLICLAHTIFVLAELIKYLIATFCIPAGCQERIDNNKVRKTQANGKMDVTKNIELI